VQTTFTFEFEGTPVSLIQSDSIFAEPPSQQGRISGRAPHGCLAILLRLESGADWSQKDLYTCKPGCLCGLLLSIALWYTTRCTVRGVPFGLVGTPIAFSVLGGGVPLGLLAISPSPTLAEGEVDSLQRIIHAPLQLEPLLRSQWDFRCLSGCWQTAVRTFPICCLIII
jgi:hypothetical protein